MTSDLSLRPCRSAATWSPPEHVTVRGTVVVLPGRGEEAAVYERFGARVAADGYVAHALVGMSPDDQANALGWLAVDAARPLVLIGSDTGALEAVVVVGLVCDTVDGVVLAGTPLADGVAATAGWAAELDARSACPVHRGRLDSAVRRGALADAVPDELRRNAHSATLPLPVLLLHGAADEVAPVHPVREFAVRQPNARLVTVNGGRHDVLNDVSHRSVAAEIVQFLERVRSSDDAAPILSVEVA